MPGALVSALYMYRREGVVWEVIWGPLQYVRGILLVKKIATDWYWMFVSFSKS